MTIEHMKKTHPKTRTTPKYGTTDQNESKFVQHFNRWRNGIAKSLRVIIKSNDKFVPSGKHAKSVSNFVCWITYNNRIALVVFKRWPTTTTTITPSKKKSVLVDYRAFRFLNYSKHLLPSHNFNANWNLYRVSANRTNSKLRLIVHLMEVYACSNVTCVRACVYVRGPIYGDGNGFSNVVCTLCIYMKRLRIRSKI